MARSEGVIKFHCQHVSVACLPQNNLSLVCELIAWREILMQLQAVGMTPTRYGGAGFGNLSARVSAPGKERGERSFVITGSQTGGVSAMGLEHFCVVENYDWKRNQVTSKGPVPPSSESLTHGAIYDLAPHIRYVFHTHSVPLWKKAQELRFPISDPSVPYGTPQMAKEMERLFQTTSLSEKQIVCMGGHEDGILCFGRSAEEVGKIFVSALAKAYTTACLVQS